MLTIERIIEVLKPLRTAYICAETGLHQNTVRAILNGAKRPAYDSLVALSELASRVTAQ